MKGVQCYELFRGIARINYSFVKKIPLIYLFFMTSHRDVNNSLIDVHCFVMIWIFASLDIT